MLDDLALQTPQIACNARYWFVRSEGGDLYKAFIASNSIAIAYSEISLSFINSLDNNKELHDKLKKEVKKYYPPKKSDEGRLVDRSGLAASQLFRFCIEMKCGDIVVIPSEHTSQLTIGVITDNGAFEENLIVEGVKRPHNKRRKVRWIRTVEKSKINPNLFKLFLNQQTVVDATPYADWIDPLLYQFFRKGDEFHYVLRVGAKQHIHAQALFRSLITLFELGDKFAKQEEIDANFEGVETRINLNSPGDIELWVHSVYVIGIIALLVVFINGGGFHFKGKGFDLELKTDGFLKRFNDFLNDRKNREITESVRKKLEDLNIETPEQVLDLLKGIK